MEDTSFRALVESISRIDEGKQPKAPGGQLKGKQKMGKAGKPNPDSKHPAEGKLVGEDADYGFLSKYVAEEELEEDLVSQMKKEMSNYLKSPKEVEEEGSKPKPFNHTPKIGKDIQKPKGVKTITSKEDGMLTDDENVEENSHRDRLVKKAMKPITDKEKMFPKKDEEMQSHDDDTDYTHPLKHAPDKKYTAKVNGKRVTIEWEPMFGDNMEDEWVASIDDGMHDIGTGATPKEALAAFKEINGLNEGILDKAKDFVGWDETDDERKEREATDRAYAKHRAKKKMKKNGVTVRDVHPSELMDSEDDHEVSMAHSQTQSIIHHIEELDKMIEAMDEDDELQAWFQSKLAIANDYITKMTHYLKHKTEHPVESKVPEESMDDMAYFQECVDTLVKHGVDENNAIEFVREQRKKALDNNK